MVVENLKMKKLLFSIDYFRLTPAIILLWSLFSFVFLPILPVASGYGWDGVFYGKVVLSFGDMIGEIDGYHVNRIFPAVLIHYIYIILNLPLNIESALFGYRIYNIIIIFISAILWVKIAQKLSFDNYSKWIGFTALFINYPLLNLHFYSPVLTDGTAFFIGLTMLYVYLNINYLLLIVSTMFCFFSWPAGIIVGFILFIFSNSDNSIIYYKFKST